ncbi:MAG: hypothetical protein JG774_279 [Desulfomicrobiaceae bacterium]|jgi:hypothetical protein|nr:DUF3124 domain-containing protein [Desulfomicrobiaceae bacterium]MBZ4648746.1 hypothetical protein [Desulfomicrobiaceae bacterium]MBZ4684534.1 hypothetical protein [Desulfomicrobiaceae bacterium]MDI3493560.1 hypothetical protein [Desulfomicrobiaceae bacterium]MDK2872778.1 hypothetical protein [Desulfomicrobiaceae bacterium]
MLRVLWVLCVVLAAEAAWCGPVREQTVYVPVYSHVYHGDRERPFLLAATVAVRNVDRAIPITVVAADYYDSDGRLLRRLVTEPRVIAPLASLRVVIPESDAAGGSGASCVVRWQAERPAAAPVVEAVMIGTRSSQGISFVSQGRVLEETP